MHAPEDRTVLPFRRRLLGGYRRDEVEAWAGDAVSQQVDLREQLMELREELDEHVAELRQARAQLRFHADRQTFVDGEVERVRFESERLEGEARERAAEIERSAQERAVQLVDRVCSEANTILQHARDEAQSLFSRYETDIDSAQRRIDHLTSVQLELSKGMRGAIQRAEQGLQEIEQQTPSIRAAMGAPPRRTLPTFGREKAHAAADRGTVAETPDGVGTATNSVIASIKATVLDVAEENTAASALEPATSATPVA